ncbi:STIP1 y and U box-containing protein 1 [Podochytrium sp. JEL0797]|nr:STIP1 y and U box-containing protein 1 [Podochytrium sp. JEL0797]
MDAFDQFLGNMFGVGPPTPPASGFPGASSSSPFSRSRSQQQPPQPAPPPMDRSSTTSENPASSSSRHPPHDSSPPVTVSAAEQAKLEGNSHFANHRYAEAIKAYSTAIIRNPTNPVYYSNRSLCHLRLEEFSHVVADAEKGLELLSESLTANPPISLKLWYYKGQALLAMEDQALESGTEGPGRLSEAINCLKRAFDMSLTHKSSFTEEISEKYRGAKAQRFERQDRRRREDASELHRYLTRLVERDRDRQVEQLKGGDTADVEGVLNETGKRLSEIEALFSQANENSQKRSVPDAFVGKISFEVMTDPVISPPSGITYDRSEIVSHLQKIGKWDPLTRQPLHEAELISNLALKEVIEEFLSKNGWAFDY